jgi:hypothetical protein
MDFLSSKFHKHKYVKMTFTILALIAISLILVWARAFYGSMQAYKKGEVHLTEHRYIKAVTFFDRSIHWYTPFNPYVYKSAERLWEIGLYGERQGNIRLALIAFRTIRRGFYAASNVVTPGRMWIERCESKIDELVKIEEKTEERARNFESEKKLILQSQKTGSPSIFWSIILEIGFFGWVGSVIGFIIFVLRPQKEKNYSKSQAVIWIVLTLVFLVLWTAGMMSA